MFVSTSLFRRTILALVACLALIGGALSLAPPARADTAPADPGNPATPVTVSADGLPTVQIDGVAWSQVVVGNTVYVAGKFTTARPAGAAPGANTTSRNNLLAYDIRTGALVTSFAPNLNAQALVVRASPDGSRIYVGGDFTQANGQPRYRIAAYSTATGALVPDFRPVVGSQVRSIAVSSSAVYVGGNFAVVGPGGSVPRARLAAFAPNNGAVLPWAPVSGAGRNSNGSTAANYAVDALIVAPGGGRIIAAGRFGYLNGVATSGVGALDPTSGATLPFAIGQLITNQGDNASILSLSTDGDTVYGTGYDFYGPGNLEGTFAADPVTGALRWIQECHGDHYEAFSSGGAVYTTGHAHVCSNIGGFPETSPRSHYNATAYSKVATGVVGSATFGNSTFRGSPAPNPLNWYPTFLSGTFTGQGQAGWSVTGNSQYVVYGGEFPGVNNRAQQGLIRFAVPSLAPNAIGPNANDGLTPTAISFSAGTARVSWQTTHDRDNEILTYKVFRDGDLSTPVHETTRASTFYNRPVVAFTDTGLTPGQTYSYQVYAYDPFNNAVTRNATSVTVSTTGTPGGGAYSQAVAADGAQAYWRLGEPSGPIGYDSLGAADLAVSSGVSRGVGGAIVGDGDPASGFNGTSSGLAATQTPVPGPNVFSLEAWFKTTTTQGGKIVSFGDRNTGDSSNYDRHIYMDDAGRVYFGVYIGELRTLQTTQSLNNGQWHHVVGTLGPNGMVLYVDGQQIGARADTTTAQPYSGYWRIGGDSRWTGTSNYFNGQIDDVSLYHSVLSGGDVASHYDLGTGVPPPNVVPTAAFSSSVSGLVASVDAADSADPDGTIAAYTWTFGDGATGTGAVTSHAYAVAGTYDVTLTVTDDDGATDTSTQPVTVTAGPALFAQDGFERTVTNGFGVAEVGGGWTVVGTPANYAVTGGAAAMTNNQGSTRTGYLNGVSVADVAVQVGVSLDQAPTGSGVYVSVIGRHVGSNDYRAKLRFYSTGAVQVQLTRVVSGAETTLATVVVPGLTYAAGQVLQVRLDIAGINTATMQAKVWRSGSAEPAGWQITATDSTSALRSAGGIGLASYLAGSSTNRPTTRFDDLWAGEAGTAPPG